MRGTGKFENVPMKISAGHYYSSSPQLGHALLDWADWENFFYGNVGDQIIVSWYCWQLSQCDVTTSNQISWKQSYLDIERAVSEVLRSKRKACCNQEGSRLAAVNGLIPWCKLAWSSVSAFQIRQRCSAITSQMPSCSVRKPGKEFRIDGDNRTVK